MALPMEVLRRLVAADWEARCTATHACLRCVVSYCPHCCATHAPHHHGGGDLAPIKYLKGSPALRYEEVNGCGYGLNGVQRIEDGGRQWVPVLPPQEQDRRRKGLCVNPPCNSRRANKAQLCAISCRTEHIPAGNANGDARQRARQMVRDAQDFQGMRKDQFCTRCFRSFCARACPDHSLHHPDGVAPLVDVHRPGFGWVAVAAGLISPELAQLVQVLPEPGDGGEALHAIAPRRRDIQLALEEEDGNPNPDGCQGQDCTERVPHGVHFCSLRCAGF